MHKVEITLIDDTDGSGAAETVAFSLDHVTYEIDLNAGNADELRHTIVAWAIHGRQVLNASPKGAWRRRNDPSAAATALAVRTWAKGRGYQVADRGRIPAPIMTEWKQSQTGLPVTPCGVPD